LEAKARIEAWRNGFAQAAVQAVNLLIKDNAEILKTPADIKNTIGLYLSKVVVSPGTDNETYAYQWAEWLDNGAERKVSANFKPVPCTNNVSYCRVFVKTPLSSAHSQSRTWHK
jgi:hypothetical protein